MSDITMPCPAFSVSSPLRSALPPCMRLAISPTEQSMKYVPVPAVIPNCSLP